MRLKILYILVLGLLVRGNYAQAQIKYEREYKLKPTEIPMPAKIFVDSCKFSTQITWYKEESQDGKSIEAKLKHKGKKYSIEFDTVGLLQDMEIQIRESEIFSSVKEKMLEYLAQNFIRFKFIGVQLQLTGKRKDLISLLRAEGRIEGITQKFEVIIKGKKDKTHSLYEILFNDQGEMERISQIKTRNTDNLDF